ncbi:MAG: hypothetical protein NVSMB32_00700 [Actinomycetota bacterium]
MSTPAPWQERFVEQVGLHTDVGLPRTLARVFAWLVVCQPRHQSAEQLRQTLGISTGSVSTATTSLVRAGIVARRSFPGERRIYYELHAQGWRRLMAGRLRALSEVRALAEQALAEGAGRADDRLQGMRDFYAAYESLTSQLMGASLEPDAKRRKGSRKNSKP